ncbi:unnamed protein product [Chrysoparadoxa australica]
MSRGEATSAPGNAICPARCFLPACTVADPPELASPLISHFPLIPQANRAAPMGLASSSQQQSSGGDFHQHDPQLLLSKVEAAEHEMASGSPRKAAAMFEELLDGDLLITPPESSSQMCPMGLALVQRAKQGRERAEAATSSATISAPVASPVGLEEVSVHSSEAQPVPFSDGAGAAAPNADDGDLPWERGWTGGNGFVNAAEKSDAPDPSMMEHEKDSPRNFTLQQLHSCTGGEDEKGKPRMLCIGLKCVIFDVSAGADIYGPGGKYHSLAGHEASLCLARLAATDSAIDEALLDSVDISAITRIEAFTLGGWVDTFHAKHFPVLGCLVPTPIPRAMTRSELTQYDGTQPVPPGWAAAPCYVGCNKTVFDVSFGGTDMYVGEEAPYTRLAGNDASRVLAKMSMANEDVNGELDYENLTEKEQKNLLDWYKKLSAKYPTVGTLAAP